MENELIFEHLIKDHVSNCIRWADLYRAASLVNAKGDSIHPFKVGEVYICLLIALNKLMATFSGEKLELVQQQYNALRDCEDFDTIDEAITNLHEQNIIF